MLRQRTIDGQVPSSSSSSFSSSLWSGNPARLPGWLAGGPSWSPPSPFLSWIDSRNDKLRPNVHVTDKWELSLPPGKVVRPSAHPHPLFHRVIVVSLIFLVPNARDTEHMFGYERIKHQRARPHIIHQQRPGRVLPI